MQRGAAVLVLVVAVAGGCSRKAPEGTTPGPPSALPMVVASAVAPSVAPAEVPPPPSASAAGSSAAGKPEPPAGYVAMTVLEVVPTERGDAVLLVDAAESVVVPIFVGGTEALSIKLRLERQRYQRPLTHDLLDDVVGKLGGAVWKVQVDELRGNIFVGSVFVRSEGRVVTVDARPSDAIALALGNRVPIFVADKVVKAGGIDKADLKRKSGAGIEPRGKLPEPMSL